jgi:hypothetical protein
MFNASADQATTMTGIDLGVQPLTSAFQNNGPLGMARYAVRVRLPQALLHGRRPAVAAMFMAPLRDFAEQRGCRLFAGAAADVFLALTEPDLVELDRPLARMRQAITLADSTDASPLAVSETWDLGQPDQRQAFLALLDSLNEQARSAARGHDPSALHTAGSIDPAQVCRRVTPDLAARRAQRRTVLAIYTSRHMSGLFDDYTLAEGQWQQALAGVHNADAQCAAGSDLKQELKIGVARAILHGLLPSSDIPLGIHLPISKEASSVLGDIVDASGNERLYIEVDVRDAVASFELYDDMRDVLQRAGHRLVLRANGISDVSFIDLPTTQADFIRIHRRLGAAGCIGGRAAWQAAVAQIGGERLIIGDIDDEQRLQDGIELGIRHFCGHYIERLAAKLRMKGTMAP